MYSLATYIQKGGTGKSSITGTLGYLLSKQGRTIICDVDPQGNLSSWYTGNGEIFSPKYELADILYGEVAVTDATIKITDNFHLIPTFGLDTRLKLYGENQLSNEPFIFEDLLQELNKQEYKFVVFDLSPSISRLEKSVLIAVDEVLTPVQPEYFGLDGIEIFKNELSKLNKNFRKQIRHNRIIVSGLNHTIEQHKTIYEAIPQNYNIYTIPVDPVFRKAQALGIPIFEMKSKDKPKQQTFQEFNKLATDIVTAGKNK